MVAAIVHFFFNLIFGILGGIIQMMFAGSVAALAAGAIGTVGIIIVVKKYRRARSR